MKVIELCKTLVCICFQIPSYSFNMSHNLQTFIFIVYFTNCIHSLPVKIKGFPIAREFMAETQTPIPTTLVSYIITFKLIEV